MPPVSRGFRRRCASREGAAASGAPGHRHSRQSIAGKKHSLKFSLAVSDAGEMLLSPYEFNLSQQPLLLWLHRNKPAAHNERIGAPDVRAKANFKSEIRLILVPCARLRVIRNMT